MPYVDGFVLAVTKAKVPEYRKMARLGGKVWMEHGALSYVEALADDVPYGELTSFPRAVHAKEDEGVVFAWVAYRSRAHRDAVMKKITADPRMKAYAGKMPFDAKRMIFGGFKSFVGH